MSEPGETDRDKGFLARWSQRKQEAQREEAKVEPPPAESTEADTVATSDDALPNFDISALPKLEELTGSTDITAFLQKGVPEHLRNAALRKSWALDPAIRNYVSPALEYAYDWNAPGGVPGGGELDAGIDVARMVAQIMGEPAVERVKFEANCEEEAAESGRQPERDLESCPTSELPEQPVRRVEESSAETSEISMTGDDVRTSIPDQPESADAVATQPSVRRHGTAKPIL